MPDRLMRFMVIGPADARNAGERIPLAEPQVVAAAIESGGMFGVDWAKASAALRAFASSSGFVHSVADLAHARELAAFRKTVQDAVPSTPSADLLKASFPRAKDVVGTPGWNMLRSRVNDSLVAAKLVAAGTPPLRAQLALRLLEMAAVEKAMKFALGAAELRNALEAPLALPLRLSRPSPASEAALGELSARASERIKLISAAATQKLSRVADLERRRARIESSLTQLVRLVDELQCPSPNAAPNAPRNAPPKRPEATECAADLDAARSVLTFAMPPGQEHIPGFVLSRKNADQLPKETLAVLAELGLNPTSLGLVELSKRLVSHRDETLRELERARPMAQQKTGVIGGVQVTRHVQEALTVTGAAAAVPLPSRFDASMLRVWGDILGDAGLRLDGPIWLGPWTPGPSRLRPAGVGRLYVIRQHIKEYRGGEVSHIENVLAGETRERTHLRRRRLEQVSISETETETEEERSLQTTQRSELEREVEETLREQFNTRGGVQVSATYGAVSFSASGEVAYARASEESVRTAQKLAREVIETAREKVKERVLERRERRLIEEVEETNRHAFAGGEAQRVGVYQWFDKVYRAEVFSYSERTMYDLLVPEPAAGLIAAATAAPPSRLGELQYPGTFDVVIDEITPETVNGLVARFGLTESIPGYPRDKIVSAGFASSSEKNPEQTFFSETKQVTIPQHYFPHSGTAQFRGRREQHEASQPATFGLTVGPLSHRFAVDNIGAEAAGGSAILAFSFEPWRGSADAPGGDALQVGCAGDDFSAFVLTVTLRMRPNAEAFAEWRRQVHAALRLAYEQKLQEWRDAQGVAAFDAGQFAGALLGRNPAANRQAERVELQRAVVEIMRNRPLFWNLLRDTPEGGFPTLELDRLALEAPEIRFLQQAFEWENMTYVLYPYFYGRPVTWSVKALLQDIDPRWVEFLQAGAARVQIPVREGFAAAVDHYMMTGEPWLGRDEPAIGDESYLSLYEEERARLGGNAPETHHEAEDFDVEVPTTLVKLRADASLPRWERGPDGWREVAPT